MRPARDKSGKARRRFVWAAPFRLIAFALLALSLEGVALAGPASGGAKLDPQLRAMSARGALDGTTTRVIVTTRSGAADRVAGKWTGGGRQVRATFKALHGVSLSADARDLDALASDPDVLSISLDLPVAGVGRSKTTSTKTSPSTKTATDSFASYSAASATSTSTWQSSHVASTVGAEGLVVNGRPVWGVNVGVAVIDSGIASTGDYWISAFVDFVNGRTRPYDDYGHGTHVAGLIASSGLTSDGLYRGVAPGVRLIGLKVLDAHGAGYTSAVLAALDYAIANRTSLGIDVVNISLGHPIAEPAATDPLVQAVEAASRAGLVVVVSAGNHGCDPETGEVGYAGISSPGNAPSAITVGAIDTKQTLTRTDDEVTLYSSRGPTWYDGVAKPDLVAPGHRLTSDATGSSTLSQQLAYVDSGDAWDWLPFFDPNSGFVTMSGTSMAAAVTSGAVALMIDAHRTSPTPAPLAPNTVKAILQHTALDLAGADALTQGAGALNAAGAARLAAVVNPAAAEGTWWLTGTVTPTTTLGTEVYAWARRVVWGDRIVWTDAIYVNEPAWSLRVVWGDLTIFGDRIVWTDSLVWGNRIVWADRLVWDDAVWGDRIVWCDRIVWTDGVRPSW